MIGYIILNILTWFMSWIDVMLFTFPFMQDYAEHFKNLIGYLDLLVLYVRPLFPQTTHLIFETFENIYIIYIVFLFVAIVKRIIPFYGNSKTKV